MQWTDEQRRAIEARGTNLLLSAAAGSGKTTVLVERVLQLVAEGADVDRMLIVTFTRAAAADMRAKLSKSLSERAAEDKRCREQLMRLERASITTLHAFCADFLRSNFEAAGVDPAFRIMDDAENRRLLDEALDEALENAYARGGAEMEALDFGRGPAGVRAAAERLYAFLQERPDPWQWLADAQDAEKMLPLWEEELMNAGHKAVRLGLAGTDLALSLPECPDNYARALEADAEILADLDALEDYEQLREGLENFKQTRPKGRSGRSEEEMKEVKAARKAAGDAVKSARMTMFALERSRADIRASVFALGALAEIVRDLAELHEKGKREASGLTYSDLEHFTLRALRDDDTARAMREKYDFVFVDEYQDTSDVQEAIVSRVRREDNLFMVGDVKQSIYRFRLAEPKLFLEKYDRYRRGEGGQLLPLTRNFRSAGPVLDFTNAVFEHVMTGGDAEVEYDELARLNAGTEAQKSGAPVEIHIISGDAAGLPESDEDDEQEAEMVEGAQREGALIAGRIIEMMREDPSLHYRDFVILTRAKTSAFSVILPMLAAHGIPAYADGAEGFFESMEISLLLEILQLIANRRSDVALIGVLRSSVAGLTNEELARIRIASPRTPFLDAALACAENDDVLGRKLKGFFEKLDSWRMRAGVLSLDALVRAVLDESGFYAYAGALPAGAQRQANLDAFVNHAAKFDKDISGSLTRFLRYTEDMRVRGDGDAAHLLGENDDVVRLMTVHRSKGLEFKVVFGALLGRRYPHTRIEDTLLAHRDLGVGMLHIDPALRTRRTTLAREAISERARREDAAEEMRILYVLLTRAREKLILTGTVKSSISAEKRWKLVSKVPAAARSHLDLLMGALEENAHLLDLIIRMHEADEFYIRPQTDEDGELKKVLDQALEGELPGAKNALFAAMNWKYPDELSSRKPLKLTASGLLRELEGPGELPPLAPRPQFMSEGGMTGAERGTAYHRALQGIDLKPLAGLEGRPLVDAVRLQLDGMAKNGRLLKLEREAVSPTRIAEFLLSDAGRRLQASNTVRREWPFNVVMRANEALTAEEAGEFGGEDLLVQGTIDCCFEENGEWVLLDYKTDRTDDMDALRAHYEKQLHVYALALERITGMRVKEKKLCLLAQGKVLEM